MIEEIKGNSKNIFEWSFLGLLFLSVYLILSRDWIVISCYTFLCKYSS